MTTVIVHETCSCGASVPRKIFAAETEPKVTAAQVIWCPECGIEVQTCGADNCDQPASGVAGASRLPICRYHSILADIAGISVRMHRSRRRRP